MKINDNEASCFKNRNLMSISLVLLLSLSSCKPAPRVILDADIDSDVDDVHALAMLHAYEKAGIIDLTGVIVTSNDLYSHACTDAVNSFYNRMDIPVGYLKEQENIHSFSKYTKEVSEEFPHSLTNLSQTIEAGQLYRKLLAESPDNSVILVTIGHLTSLQDLLQSGADSISSLSGTELVRRKIKLWLCMGGQFPQGKEANFHRPDPQSTIYCLDHWTGEIIFCGWEVGEKIKTGGPYLRDKLPVKHPVRRAYELYNNFAGRSAWDQVAVSLLDPDAVGFFEMVRDGWVALAPDGSNAWKAGEHKPGRNHAFVRIKEGVDPDSIARYMDDLIISLKE